jgi:CRP-like cAMP-binding protein
MPEVDYNILKKVALFDEIKNNDEGLKKFFSIMKVTSFSAGHIIIEEGKLGNEFFILIKGQVSVLKQTPDGDRYKVVILKHEMTPALGEGGLIESEPRSATVTCDEECTFLVLTQVDFLRFCAENPQLAVPILKKISSALISRLRKMNDDLMLLHKALMTEIRGL